MFFCLSVNMLLQVTRIFANSARSFRPSTRSRSMPTPPNCKVRVAASSISLSLSFLSLSIFLFFLKKLTRSFFCFCFFFFPKEIVGEHTPKLKALVAAQVSQKMQNNDLNEQMLSLLEQYNTIV